jgi:CIC family chloride channel protein
VAISLAKLVATAISLGFGFGGGVFSPSLVIGVTLGGAYGIVVTSISPDLSAGEGAYAVIGMGAVAAAVLGAPISTSLIVFEMTGDYHITIAVMMAVIISVLIFRPFHGQSFFTWMLEQRGLDLHGGFQANLLRGISVSQVRTMRCEVIGPEVNLGLLKRMLRRSLSRQLFVVDEDGKLVGTLALADLSEAAYDPFLDNLVYAEDVVRREPPMLTVNDNLETALKLTRTSGETQIAIVEDLESRKFAGCLRETDAFNAYTQALLLNRREEHA